MKYFKINIILLIISFITVDLSAFMIGEKLTFDIKYGIIGAGRASLSITESVHQDTIPVYEIRSEARTNSFFDRLFKVRDEIVSVWDQEKLVTRKFHKRLREGSYRQNRIHFYYPEQNLTVYMRYSYSDEEWREEVMDIPDNTQDMLSSFYLVRKKELIPGESVYVQATADGRSTEVEVKVHRIEEIDTIFGKKECVVIEPILENESIFKHTAEIYIWVTNDEYKIPIKLESKVIFGHFRAILADAQKVPYSKK